MGIFSWLRHCTKSTFVIIWTIEFLIEEFSVTHITTSEALEQFITKNLMYHLIKFDSDWLKKKTFLCNIIQIFIIAFKIG